MKYWLITTEFPPIHGGGISTYCWHTAKMLTNQNNEVVVFVNDSSLKGHKEEQIEEKIRLVRFSPNQVEKGKALGYDARLSLEFANIVDQYMESEGVPDYIETQDYLGIGYYILQQKYLLYKNFRDLKVILTLHAPGFLYLDYNQVPLYKFPTYWTGELEKASILMADFVISPSNYLIDELNPRLRLNDKKPVQLFNPFRTDKSLVNNYTKNDLVFFGKLTPQKGCLEMFSYLAEMWDHGFELPIHIIGGGHHFFYPVGKDMIEHVSEKYKKYIDKGLILFEGNLAPQKLEERLSRAHVVITPSIVDNLPYAVIEAMAIGKIVLASTNGGHVELIEDSKNGFLFQHNVEGDFSKKLKTILSLSTKEIQLISVAAKNNIEKCCNYSAIYKEKIALIESHFASIKPSETFPFIHKIAKTNARKFDDNGEKDLLSIVIPYYNLGEYLEETLNSIKKVTHKKIEVIIVNDGSNEEKSIDKLNNLKFKFDLTVLNTKNQGLSATRNFGAANANGEFLAFLDADDTISPNYYSKAIEVLKSYKNVSFVGCWAQYFGESSALWPTFNPEPPYLLTHNMINSSALVYKRSDFLCFGLNDPKMIYGMEDYDSVISMVKNGARGVSFPELWWQYRIRKNSMAQSFTKNKELFLYKLITKKHADFSRNFNEEVTNLLNYNGSGVYYNNPSIELDISNRLSQKLKEFAKKNPLVRSFAKKLFRLINH